MLVLFNYNDYFFFLNPMLLVFFLWFFFFKANTTLQKITNNNSSSINLIKINSTGSFINFYLLLITLTYFNVYTLHGRDDIIWFNHFNLNNFTINLFYLFLLVSFTTFFLLRAVFKKTNLLKSVDYLFSLNNLVLLLPYLFFVNTAFTFLFLLELISTILLYKLISSKIWFKNVYSTKSTNNIPQNYINMVFFQYWITFFSTIFIVYFYINIFYIYGTTDWFVLQFLNSSEVENTQTSSNTLRMLFIVFLTSIFFKLGMAPFHLFKIEVYKGIPFLSIFFYTTYYFIIFFIFFIFLLSDLLAIFTVQYVIFLSVLLLIGSIYTIILLFDVSFLKAFFAYSTIINSIGFLIAFISNF